MCVGGGGRAEWTRTSVEGDAAVSPDVFPPFARPVVCPTGALGALSAVCAQLVWQRAFSGNSAQPVNNMFGAPMGMLLRINKDTDTPHYI